MKGVLTKLKNNLLLIDKQISLYDHCLFDTYNYIKKLKKKLKRKNYKYNCYIKGKKTCKNCKDKISILDGLFLNILIVKNDIKIHQKYIKDTKYKIKTLIKKHNVIANCIYKFL